MEKNLNPHNLEVGKKYWLRYTPGGNSKWDLITITRFTDQGYPWQDGKGVSGIVTGQYYEVRAFVDPPLEEVKLIYMAGLRKLCDMNNAELTDFVHGNPNTYTKDEVIDILTFSRLDTRYTVSYHMQQPYWQVEKERTIDLWYNKL